MPYILIEVVVTQVYTSMTICLKKFKSHENSYFK